MENFIGLNQLATAQHGLLTTAQLADAGYSDRMIATRVRDGVFRRRGKGVIQLAGTPPSWEQEVLASVLCASPNSMASHRSASRLWGFRTVDDDVEIAIRAPRKAMVDGATVHRSCDLEPADRTEVDGIPVTTPERTICDLGLIFPENEVHRILLHAIATGLVLPRDLWSMRQRTSKQGRNGTGVLDRILKALPERYEFTESGLEIRFLQLCEQYGIARPVPQLPVRVAGRSFRLDFAWIDQRVFVEVDGAAFHSTPTQIAADDNRQNLLVEAGWTPIRFTSSDLKDHPGRCVRTLNRVLGSMPENRPVRSETGQRSRSEWIYARKPTW